VLGVDMLGPCSQHLLTDLGGFYLGSALMLAWAGSSLHHELVRAASAAATLSALHPGCHTAHLKGFTTGQTAVQTAGLVAALVLPAVAYTLAGSSMSAQQATDARGRSPGGGRSL
jgi:hypothetical protein